MRPLTESQFGAWVAGLFEKYGGTRVVPKNLRSIFIVWLRDQEGATEKILQGSATAMRHHIVVCLGPRRLGAASAARLGHPGLADRGAW